MVMLSPSTLATISGLFLHFWPRRPNTGAANVLPTVGSNGFGSEARVKGASMAARSGIWVEIGFQNAAALEYFFLDSSEN
jgi:hypothetical protein